MHSLGEQLKNRAKLLSLSDSQLALVLAAARAIEDDDNRDTYFAAVAAMLRAMPDFSDSDVRRVAAQAYSAFEIREPSP